MKKFLLFSLFLIFIFSNVRAQYSVPHQWSEAILYCIRHDFARPPIHARNLHHISVVMHDAFAAYKPGSKTILLDNEWHGFYSPFYGVVIPDNPQDVIEAQEMAISYAAYRLLMWRFQNAPGFSLIFNELLGLMNSLGYDVNITSVDYVNDGPAALGNYIASRMIAYGLQDGSNEQSNFASQYYTDANPFLFPQQPGNPNMIHPNRFQRLSIPNAVDQAGNPINGTPPHLAPEWGNVKPFSLKEEDSEVLPRDGGLYRVYHNPGHPPYLDTNVQTGLMDDFFKWNFVMVSVWQSHMDTADNVMWDISPASNGNIPFSAMPTTFAEYQSFYNYFGGGDYGNGYTVNPVTNLPYEPQIVRRGDYARVLAEFWADGLDSETPPGHWFNIYNEISQHPMYEKKWKGEGPVLSDLEYDVHAYLLLGGAMHDAAISAWAIKGYYDYLRPISAIRYMGDKGQSSDPLLPNFHPAGLPLIPGYVELVMPGDPLAGTNNEHLHKIKLYTWRGHDYIEDTDTDMAGVGWILAENWWPYQRPSFVSPPFAGYISGHSTYSRTAARVMDFMTGTPYFPGGMSNFVAEQNEFLEFEEGPSETVILQWATYYDASDQCSLSRIWGGIHPPIDDIPGRIIGQQVGTDAGNFADSLFSLELPSVVDFDLNTNLINVSQIGNQLQLTLTYDQLMNTAVNPSVVFPGFAASSSLFTIQSQTWLSSTEFQLTLEVEDFEIQPGNVAISVYNAESASMVKQNPYLLLNQLYVDTKAPTMSSNSVSQAILNAQSNSSCVTLVFDETCEPSFIPVLEWSGISGIESALTFNSSASSWANSNTFNACYDFDPQLVSAAGMISFEVTNVYDLGDNVLVQTQVQNALSVDAVLPAISISSNQPLLNIASVGNNAITLTLTSTKPMSTSTLPVLTFSENAGAINVLTVNTFLSNWSDANTCNLVYNLGSVPVSFSLVDVEVNGIFDSSGNIPVSNQFNDVFTLDTERPISEVVVSNYGFINDAAVSGGNFHVEVTFSEAMNQTSFTPLVSIKDQNGISVAGVSYNVFQSLWIAPNVFRARFNVTDLNFEMENLSVEVSLARDISNNAMLLTGLEAPFNLDTRNPKLLEVSLSENNLGQSTQIITIESVFDEPMSSNVIPNFVAVTNQGDIPFFTPLLNGTWQDAYTYVGEYQVNPEYYLGSFGIRPVLAQDIAQNQIVDTVFNQVGYADFLFLSLSDINNGDVLVFPNPVNNQGAVELKWTNGLFNNASVNLYNAIGAQISFVRIETLSNQGVKLHLPDLNSGVYFVHLITEHGTHVVKIQVIQ